MKAFKAAKFRYEASPELAALFEDFRLMCNDAVRIAVLYEKEHKGECIKSRYDLIRLAYPRLKEYGLHTHYILSACEVAFAAYNDKRRKKVPCFKKPFLKLGSRGYRLDYLLLRIPTAPRRFIYLTLSGSSYHRSFLASSNLKRGSVTITGNAVILSVSDVITGFRPVGQVGVDVNERNITWSDTMKQSGREDISEVAELKARYREIRAKIASRTHKDNRVMLKLLAKYGRRERDRTTPLLHRVSKKIAEHARSNGFGVVMERLTGIRKLYRKGNGQSKSYRGRMNSWIFAEFQAQVKYKATWLGVTVSCVNPRFTSRKCPECGSALRRRKARMLQCPSCGLTEDRDLIAAKNLMACVVPQAQPRK